jgi:hypothetical protein
MSVIDGSPCDAVSVGTESQLYELTAQGASVKIHINVTEFALALDLPPCGAKRRGPRLLEQLQTDE